MSSSPLLRPPSSSSPSRIRSSGGLRSSPRVIEPTSSPRSGRSPARSSSHAVRMPIVSVHGTDERGSSGGTHMLIWGTNINLADTQLRCRNFFSLYADSNNEYKYMNLLQEILINGVGVEKVVVNFNMQDVFDFDESLYNDIVMYPVELLQIMDMVVNEIAETEAGKLQLTESPPVECRVFNMKEIKSLRDMDPTQIDTLVSVQGMVIRSSSIIPDLQQAFFQCGDCEASVEVVLEKGTIAEPTMCAKCNSKDMMELVHNRSTFKDKQLIRLQEAPGGVPDGDTPQTITLVAHEDLVDAIRVGDRVTITGVYRACSMRVKPRARTLKSIFKTYIDVLHYKQYKGKLYVESGDDNPQTAWLTDEDQMTREQKKELEVRMRAIGSDPNVYQNLLQSFAPGIHEQDDVKLGVLSQLFGGANILSTNAPNGRFRGEINILLVGDPGVAKSQLLQYVHKIAPRGIYTSGKGSSSVGLTAYITKDPETKEVVLESGALVLSDQGVCCIDEFDKMSDATRSILHEVMEQQTISIAKSGIVCSLNARTSVLAAANPVHSRYNPTLSVVDNLNLPPSLLSRFDLIYLLLDKTNPFNDRRLAKHIVSMFFENPLADVVENPGNLDIRTMTQYIAFCRSQPPPTLTDEAAHELCDGYVKMRNAGRSRKTITATPRQLESVIRLAEARAKMRLSETVTAEDVLEGIRLMKVATQSAATDPVTGVIDMEIISTGRSSSSRARLRQIAQAVDIFLADVANGQSRMSIILDYLNKDVPTNEPHNLTTMRDTREAINLLIIDEKVIRTGGEGRDESFMRVGL